MDEINKWTIIKKNGERKGEEIVLAKCKCGTLKNVILNTIINNLSKCCGCNTIKKNINKTYGYLNAIK